MSFDRRRAQLKCESLLDCSTLMQWNSKQNDFKTFALSAAEAADLRADLRDDSLDHYYKGLLSLCEAISSIDKHLFSWAVVRLYYSVFYFLQGSLASNGYAVIRNKCLYLLKVAEGEVPIKKASKRYRNSHQGVIMIYQDLYKSSDKLQSNTIDGINPYEWLSKKRNQINYRERQFHDPRASYFLSKICQSVTDNKLNSLIQTYLDDEEYLYCFQSDHASLALPIKRALLTRDDLTRAGIDISFPKEKMDLLTELLKFGPKRLSTAGELLR